MTPEEWEDYLCQDQYYWSDSRGKMPISEMFPGHAENAARKLARDRPGVEYSPLYLALLAHAQVGTQVEEWDGEEEPF